jgi:hypothetical protein
VTGHIRGRSTEPPGLCYGFEQGRVKATLQSLLSRLEGEAARATGQASTAPQPQSKAQPPKAPTPTPQRLEGEGGGAPREQTGQTPAAAGPRTLFTSIDSFAWDQVRGQLNVGWVGRGGGLGLTDGGGTARRASTTALG